MTTATNAQVKSFVNQWSGAANTLHYQTGVPAVVYLGQWGMETGFGTQPNMGKNNPGNVMQNGKPQNFSSQSAFLASYLPSVMKDFKWTPAKQAYTGQSLSSYLKGLFGGPNSYNPGNNTYNVNVGNGVSTILSAYNIKPANWYNANTLISNIATHQHPGTNFEPGNGVTAPNGTVPQPNALSGGVNWSNLLNATTSKVLTFAVGAGLIVVGLVILFRRQVGEAVVTASRV